MTLNLQEIENENSNVNKFGHEAMLENKILREAMIKGQVSSK